MTIKELLEDPDWELEPELIARHMIMTINPADFVIMSEDLFAVPLDQIREVRVLETAVGGKVVHRADRKSP